MEYTALYRKFRPVTFEEILGQEHITKTIKNQVIANRVGHAYLFTGCRGCGKTTTAKVLSRAINCLNPQNGEPCNECEICKAALEGSLTDIVEMDAASNNGVDDIRAIREEVNFLPTLAKYRVYIIDEVHMLSIGAFNALLKTLEEPPKHVKFILATTEPQKLPATILSRCQRFDFKKIPDKEINLNLKKVCDESKIKYTEGALNLITELSEGAMRDALSILERCAQDGENDINEEKIKELVGIPQIVYIYNILENIANYNEQEEMLFVEKLIKEGKDINNVLWETIKYCKDMLLLDTTKEVSNVYSSEDIKQMNNLISKIDKERLLNIIYELSKLENDIKYSTQKNIVFQVGLLKLCRKENGNLEERISKIEEILKNGINVPVKKQEKQQEKKTINPFIDNNEVPEKKEEVKKEESKKEETSFWNNVIAKLKEERKPMLYANLINTKAIVLDDMTIGIEFPNGINSFGKSVIEKEENMQELKKLVSIECKKDMRIKLIDNKEDKTNKAESPLDLGIKINILD